MLTVEHAPNTAAPETGWKESKTISERHAQTCIKVTQKTEKIKFEK
jgi:hypothetical protein